MPSAEQIALVSFAKASGAQIRVTDYSTPGIHSRTSYHYANPPTAVDFAGRVPYGMNPTVAHQDMQQLYEWLEPLAREGVLLELFYRDQLWKRGRRIVSSSLTRSHMNHVHAAVRPGWRYVTPEVIIIPDNPELPNLQQGPATLHVGFNSDGYLTFYIQHSPKGEVHIWTRHDENGKPYAEYLGRSEVTS